MVLGAKFNLDNGGSPGMLANQFGKGGFLFEILAVFLSLEKVTK
jgi:hypothetical protein